MFVCFNKEKELTKFFEDIISMRREGNTEEKEKGGFAGLMQRS
jgi:hypothetical protein